MSAKPGQWLEPGRRIDTCSELHLVVTSLCPSIHHPLTTPSSSNANTPPQMQFDHVHHRSVTDQSMTLNSDSPIPPGEPLFLHLEKLPVRIPPCSRIKYPSEWYLNHGGPPFLDMENVVGDSVQQQPGNG